MLRISPLFSDGAVLCRGKELRIFGEAEDGARVHCELRDGMDGLLAQGDAVAADGRFLILLAPQEARTGCRLLIADGEDTSARWIFPWVRCFWRAARATWRCP